MGYLLFPIVLPWATFGYLLCDACCSPRVAQPLAIFCSSLGYPLFGSQWSSLMGFPIKIIKIFQSLMFVSFSYRFHLLVCTRKLFLPPNPWLWATYCFLLSYHYLWLHCVMPVVAQGPSLWLFCSSLGYPLFGSQWSSLMGCPYKNYQNFSKSDVCLLFI